MGNRCTNRSQGLEFSDLKETTTLTTDMHTQMHVSRVTLTLGLLSNLGTLDLKLEDTTATCLMSERSYFPGPGPFTYIHIIMSH